MECKKQKAGCKKQGHCYSKKEEAGSLLFKKRRGSLFQVIDPKKISGQPDNLEQWVQIDWAIECCPAFSTNN